MRALDGVDLEVRAGEVHCLLGQNGAGKSTLIKVLAGAHQPDDGRDQLAGRGRSRSPTRRPRCRPASPPSTRSSTWSTASASRRTSSSATSTPAPASCRRGTRTRAAARDAGPARATPRSRRRREVGRLLGRRQADRQHGPGAVARGAADHHGRAERRAGPRRGGQPVPDHPRADRAGHRGHLHLAPAGGDPRDRRPGDRAQGRPHRRRRTCRPATTPTARRSCR